MFHTFVNELKANHDVKVSFKKDSAFMKFLNIFVGLFNKKFMETYITTIGSTVYYPTPEFVAIDVERAIRIMAHEFVHIMQSARHGLWFSIGYLFPQILAVLALLAIPLAFFSWWGLLPLLFLICLLPLPAYWRKKWEADAYTMTLFVHCYFMKKHGFDETTIAKELFKRAKWISETQFENMAYFKMWPWGVTNILYAKIPDIVSGDICSTDEVYGIVEQSLNRSCALHY